MYDAIIVGARCAGAPTARLLARRGYRVLLVDKARFPSDTMSTHYIHQPGVAKLKRWGLLDRVVATGCPPVTRFTFDLGRFALTGSPPPTPDGVKEAYVPRRRLLDKILIDAAVDAGVELREGFTVQEILTDGDRVTGIRGRGEGRAQSDRARIVIGADGLHSIVARQVAAPTYHETPTLTCGYYSYWSGVPIDGAELYPRDRRFIVAFPTNDGLTCVAVQWTRPEFHAFRSDIAGNFDRTLDLAPSLADRVRAGRREERWVGTANLPNFFRKPYGAGWALVGDAGYHKDPNTGEGITDAFRDAELLADAIDAGFSGRRSLTEALADYERQRNESVMPIYDLTRQLASLQPPPPDMQQLFGALRGNQADTDRFLGVIAGTTSISEFFAEDNVRRIIAAAQPAAA